MTEESKMAVEVGACCICLSEVHEALVCPDGHVTCHEDLNGLVAYVSAPEQLRRHRGCIPCPWWGEEGQCEHTWDYREVHSRIDESTQLQYAEGAVNLLSKLLDGSGAVASRPVAALEEGEGDPEVQDIVAKVMSILNLRCPLCAAVFVDFEACCAVTCAACGVCFCALCLDESAAGEAADVHVHLVAKHGDLFFPPAEILSAHNALRSEQVVTYFKSLGRQCRGPALAALDTLRPAMADLQLDLEPILSALRRFYEGPRGLSPHQASPDDPEAPAVVVRGAAAFTRRRSLGELSISDVTGVVGRFDPGDVVRVLDNMGVLLGWGVAALLCTGRDFIVTRDQDDDRDDEAWQDEDVDNVAVLTSVRHLGASRDTSAAGETDLGHLRRRPRMRPRNLPPLFLTFPPHSLSSPSTEDLTWAEPLSTHEARRRPPALSLHLLSSAQRNRRPHFPAPPSPPWTFDTHAHAHQGGGAAVAGPSHGALQRSESLPASLETRGVRQVRDAPTQTGGGAASTDTWYADLYESPDSSTHMGSESRASSSRGGFGSPTSTQSDLTKETLAGEGYARNNRLPENGRRPGPPVPPIMPRGLGHRTTPSAFSFSPEGARQRGRGL